MLSISLAGGFGGWGDAASLPFLDHSLLPFGKRAIYLRLVKTNALAQNYAKAGFHVSVTRGKCGGAADLSSDFASGGTVAGSCDSPLNREDLRQKWADAAKAYFDAYNAVATSGWQTAVPMIRGANALADAAYSAEGVAPPRDPETLTVEGPHPKPAPSLGMAGFGVGIALVALIGGVVASRNAKKQAHAYM